MQKCQCHSSSSFLFKFLAVAQLLSTECYNHKMGKKRITFVICHMFSINCYFHFTLVMVSAQLHIRQIAFCAQQQQNVGFKIKGWHTERTRFNCLHCCTEQDVWLIPFIFSCVTAIIQQFYEFTFSISPRKRVEEEHGVLYSAVEELDLHSILWFSSTTNFHESLMFAWFLEQRIGEYWINLINTN